MTNALNVMLAVGLILVPSVPLYAQENTPIHSAPPSESPLQAANPENQKISPTEDQHAVATPPLRLWPPYEQPSRLPAYGKAMYYNPGVMELVLENRLKAGQVVPCRDCVGYVAMLRVGDLNSKVWIQLPDATVEGPFQVIDTADKRHIPMLINKGWIVDVDYETAMRWGMAGPRLVTVWAEPPLSYRTLSNSIASAHEYEVDIYRHEKLDYFNQSHEYAGYVDALYVR